jgi:hypothetical protein
MLIPGIGYREPSWYRVSRAVVVSGIASRRGIGYRVSRAVVVSGIGYPLGPGHRGATSLANDAARNTGAPPNGDGIAPRRCIDTRSSPRFWLDKRRHFACNFALLAP